ncbi:vanin-like protein 3 [Ischnura elegans]|uniref:vanin-like protein 3 n=1 Tax=Ischnura elegans TaxID=197161 RepID=UPI001ED890B3|nr:vanin-like protein 3 [Ischnura elegans]
MGLLHGILFVLLIPLCAAHRKTYRAAVVEYHPLGDRHDNASHILNLNVAEYETLIEEAKRKGADIVVFPEYGLTQLAASSSRNLAIQFAQSVPTPPAPGTPSSAAQVPCLLPNSSMAIRRLSCSARENQIYVVVNLLEIAPCSITDHACPEDGFFIYNTNVAFDRNGGVVSKYHKYNLFKEPSVNTPKHSMYSTFDTDFGVTFGMFICFDILFEDPGYTLVKRMNVNNMIYSTAWISELPFLTATQTQQSWSLGLGVNLLASGFNNPMGGNGGSGIYAGGSGRLNLLMPSTAGTTLLLADVPVVSSNRLRGDSLSEPELSLDLQTGNQATSGHMFVLHDDLSNYKSSEVLKNGLNELNMCQNNLCCNFKADVQLSSNGSQAPKYRFVITDSIIKYARTYPAHVQVCGLIYCKGDDVSKCVYFPDLPETLDNVSFRSLGISGNFSSPRMVLPSTLTTSLEPLKISSGNLMEKDEAITLEYNSDTRGLLTFALYGRIFQQNMIRNEEIMDNDIY